MDRIPITKEGYQKIKSELERLKTVERRAVVEAIKEARGHGDLSENAEYDAAKERQGMIEAKIAELESKMGKFEIIDTDNLTTDKVVFGVYVEIENVESDEIKKYRIVGPDESDISRGYISVFSPIARALIGKKVGDEVVVNAPGGEIEYEIINITKDA
ncbi:transcription elongation factor GreA [Deferribacterales bacterium Es71-Z0220]|jgi:transcription elongation factor GreA|uniref:transcription elongation factor GreA n=1 Tax=Deferrivibrio essentukiensis TaxID=2880922 RepID=UPI001F6136A5|nr:transcription elongation factor GreA [Deferrivibrio essentukiensis]MBZ4671931.1 transcription elongation factor GreA [Deferribacteraceae bacterium]MCB4204198.1 transcription elongation factor GreA [Deferrivibrio essentukiensis]